MAACVPGERPALRIILKKTAKRRPMVVGRPTGRVCGLHADVDAFQANFPGGRFVTIGSQAHPHRLCYVHRSLSDLTPPDAQVCPGSFNSECGST
jgi:hypothetical protein